MTVIDSKILWVRKFVANFIFAISILIVVPDFNIANAQEPTGRVGAFSLPNSPWDVQWQRFRENVQASGLELEYFIRGELGSEESMLASLKRDRLQVSGISLQGIASVIPEINIAMAPFLFRSQEEVDFIYDKVLLKRANQLLEPHGIILLRWLESGWLSIGAQSPIQAPADIQGLRIGGSPNVAIQSFLTAVGADAIPIASVDLVQALQTGLVDGAIKPTALIYSNLREDVKTVALLNVAYDTGGLLANRGWAVSLPNEHFQALVEGHGPSDAVRGEVRKMVDEQIEEMSALGIQVTIPSIGERNVWEGIGLSLHDDIIEQVGGRTQAVYDEIREALENYRLTN